MKRNSGVREMEPVKCRVTEVTSLQDSVMLGTYGEIMNRSALSVYHMTNVLACFHISSAPTALFPSCGL